MVTVVVLSRYQDILDQFLESYREYGSKESILHRKVVITESNLEVPRGWELLRYSYNGRFNQPAIMNFMAANTEGDVMYFSDDIEYTHPWTVAKMYCASRTFPDVGIVSPLIDGEIGMGIQRVASSFTLVPCLCAPCLYFRRECLDVARWDERFIGEGWEDIDYCLAAGEAGWKSAVTPTVTVRHGFQGIICNATYQRKTDRMSNGLAYNQHLFGEKWMGKLDFLGPITPDDPVQQVLCRLREAK